MQVGNFSLYARKPRLAGLFVNRNNIHKKWFVVKRAFFLVPKTTKLQNNTWKIKGCPPKNEVDRTTKDIFFTPQS